MPDRRHCPLCGSAGIPEERLDPLPFHSCTGCGHVFRLTDGNEGEAASVYRADNYGHDRHEIHIDGFESARLAARVRLRLVQRRVTSGDLLDVGAATGAFVYEAARAGFTARGHRAEAHFAAFACETANVDVTEAALEEVALEREALDVVTLWHVLEHLADPVAQLIRIRSSVRSVGLLALEVPNYASAVARHLGTDWPHLDPDVHLSQFTPETLGTALRQSGFEDIELWTVPITPYLTPVGRLGARGTSRLGPRPRCGFFGHSARTIRAGTSCSRALARPASASG